MVEDLANTHNQRCVYRCSWGFPQKVVQEVKVLVGRRFIK
jgi:hypothetical protein